jgi:thiamine-phosphate pyrophosphorylase
MKLVLITDRRLMGGAEGFGAAIARAVKDLPAHRAIVQVREKDLGGAARLALVRAAMDAAPEQLVIVNDRLDVVLAAAAGGVHLPEDGMDVFAARAAIAAADGPTPCADAPPVLVGCSRHSADAAIAASDDGADLVQLGPVWSTPSKERYGAALGIEALTPARARMNPRCLLVAIGGIDSPARAAAARAAGADAIAVVRAVWTSPDPAAAALALA